MDSVCLIIMWEWNANLITKIFSEQRANWFRHERNLIDFINEFGLDDRYQIDRPWWDM